MAAPLRAVAGYQAARRRVWLLAAQAGAQALSWPGWKLGLTLLGLPSVKRYRPCHVNPPAIDTARRRRLAAAPLRPAPPVRPQTSEAMRVRCLEAQELLGYLQAFSCLPGPGDLERLPRIFTDDATMAEAAVGGARRLLLATSWIAPGLMPRGRAEGVGLGVPLSPRAALRDAAERSRGGTC